MGSAASKGARRLPTKAPSAVHPPPAVPRPPPSAAPDLSPPSGSAEAASNDNAGSGSLESSFEYGARGARGEHRATRGDGGKDDAILKDGMDPQFMANLARLGPVAVPQPAVVVRTPPLAQRTLGSRNPRYTNPKAVPPPGTITASMFSSLLDDLKILPPGADASKVFKRYGVTAEEMATLRRWVNSPSVGEEEEIRVEDGTNGTVEQIVEVKAVWVDPQDIRS